MATKEDKTILIEELNNAIRYHVNVFFYDESEEKKIGAKDRLKRANKAIANFDEQFRNEEH